MAWRDTGGDSVLCQTAWDSVAVVARLGEYGVAVWQVRQEQGAADIVVALVLDEQQQ